MKLFFPLVLLLSSCVTQPSAPVGRAIEGGGRPEGMLLATFYPTPHTVVRAMLELAGVEEGERLIDLGSGDGRIVIAAARDFGALAIGFEIDPEWIAASRDNIRRTGLEERARIEARDLLTADFAEADVITSFLTPEAFESVGPVLEAKLRPGVRVVCYKFAVVGWTPEQVVEIEDPDPEIPLHQIFLYRRLAGGGLNKSAPLPSSDSQEFRSPPQLRNQSR